MIVQRTLNILVLFDTSHTLQNRIIVTHKTVLERDTAVGAHLALQTGDLASGELVHAAVVAVVHVVVDGVDTGAGAGVTAGGASRGKGRLGRGVRNLVAGAAAATLESVVETDPVTGLVGEGPAEVEVGGGTAGDGGEEDDDTIVGGVGSVVRGEGGVAQKTLVNAAGETDGVDVQSVRAALAKLTLHGGLQRRGWADRVEPVGVHGAGGTSEREAQAGARVVLVQDVDLGGKLGIGDVSAGNS